MSQTSSTYRETSAAVILLLKLARENGLLVNRVKLAKLLYLADVRAVGADLPPGTGVEWRWRHYGPHSGALQAVEADLFAAGVITVERVTTYYGNVEVRFRLLAAQPDIDIDRQFAEILGGVVREFGRLSASQLKEISYQTAPMRAAVERGEREIRLDLTGGAPYPDLAPALSRLRAVLRTLPPAEDEDGGIEDLRAEMTDLAELRASATRQMVD